MLERLLRRVLGRVVREIAMEATVESLGWLSALDEVIEEGIAQLNKKGAGARGPEVLSQYVNNGAMIEFVVDRSRRSYVMLRVHGIFSKALYNLLLVAATDKCAVGDQDQWLQPNGFELKITAYAAVHAPSHSNT